jgi:N-carbamoylputrescine amidase
MGQNSLRVALVTEVFPEPSDWKKLPEVLDLAREKGAELAVLPEIPLNPWSPISKVARPEDAEEVDGPRQEALASAASEVGIAVAGGAIIRDPDSGIRHNTALVYDSSGSCLARYKKVHLPEEEGFWETSHYEPGTDPPSVVDGLPLRLGLQICSDVNRTSGFQLLGAMGAEVVLASRCTPPQTYDRWRLVLRADAVTSGTYVISVNRPAPTPHGLIGGPSIAISPTSEVLLETTEPLGVVELKRDVVEAARVEYPGYLKVFPKVYARGWQQLEGEE